MKRIFISLMTVLVCISATSQQIEPTKKTQLPEQDYLQKSKKQKTTAWILLAGGTGMLLLSGTIAVAEASVNVLNSMGGNETQRTSADDILFIAGSAAMLGSIPLFIAAGKNKRKAMDISLNLEFEKTLVVNKPGKGNNYFTALSLHINLK